MKYYIVPANAILFKQNGNIVAPSQGIVEKNIVNMFAGDEVDSAFAVRNFEDAVRIANEYDPERRDGEGFLILEVEKRGRQYQESYELQINEHEMQILDGFNIKVENLTFVKAHLSHLDASLHEGVVLNCSYEDILERVDEELFEIFDLNENAADNHHINGRVEMLRPDSDDSDEELLEEIGDTENLDNVQSNAPVFEQSDLDGVEILPDEHIDEEEILESPAEDSDVASQEEIDNTQSDEAVHDTHEQLKIQKINAYTISNTIVNAAKKFTEATFNVIKIGGQGIMAGIKAIPHTLKDTAQSIVDGVVSSAKYTFNTANTGMHSTAAGVEAISHKVKAVSQATAGVTQTAIKASLNTVLAAPKTVFNVLKNNSVTLLIVTSSMLAFGFAAYTGAMTPSLTFILSSKLKFIAALSVMGGSAALAYYRVGQYQSSIRTRRVPAALSGDREAHHFDLRDQRNENVLDNSYSPRSVFSGAMRPVTYLYNLLPGQQHRSQSEQLTSELNMNTDNSCSSKNTKQKNR